LQQYLIITHNHAVDISDKTANSKNVESNIFRIYIIFIAYILASGIHFARKK